MLFMKTISETVICNLKINQDLAEVVTIDKRRKKWTEHIEHFQVVRNFKQWVVVMCEFNQRNPQAFPNYFVLPARKNERVVLPLDYRYFYFYNLKTDKYYEFDQNGKIQKADFIAPVVSYAIHSYKLKNGVA